MAGTLEGDDYYYFFFKEVSDYEGREREREGGDAYMYYSIEFTVECRYNYFDFLRQNKRGN